ncbi:hypothetical protein [Streptomyces griseochromogenes]|uniref:hypothetical protein n=1 Tax=Streptomyces griseochromogenes TaxID=68214 RepID=UPI00378D1EAE
MTDWRVRDYAQDGLEALIRVDMESRTTEEPPLFPLSDAVTALQAQQTEKFARIQRPGRRGAIRDGRVRPAQVACRCPYR